MKKRTYKRTGIILLVILVIAIIAVVFVWKYRTGESKVEILDDKVLIETEYAELNFPEKWKDDLKVHRTKQHGVDAVEFSGLYKEKEIPLFTILFGGEGDFIAGTITRENGDEIKVAVKFAEIEFDDSWTQEDIDKISAMQEDINYVLEQLEASGNFTRGE